MFEIAFNVLATLATATGVILGTTTREGSLAYALSCLLWWGFAFAGPHYQLMPLFAILTLASAYTLLKPWFIWWGWLKG